MFKKILVPLDGSKLATQVFPPLVELARAFGSEVCLVGVCESEESEEKRAFQLYIDNEASQLKEIIRSSAVRIKTEVLEGKPAEQIIDYAQKNDISLIIFSSHGRSGIMPWSLGSTVNKVIHKVGIPLIIVKAKEDQEELVKVKLFNRILTPLDCSKTGETVLPYMIELGKKLDFEVILLHVIELGKHVHTVGGLEYVRFHDLDIDKEKTEAKTYLDEISSRFARTKATITSEIRVGDASKEIINMADEKGCSLISLSSHGHSAIEAWAYGSVTGKILQVSEHSLMFVPALETK